MKVAWERSIVDGGNPSLAFFIYNSLIRTPNSASFAFIFVFFREFTSSFFGAKKRSCVADKATASAPFWRRFFLGYPRCALLTLLREARADSPRFWLPKGRLWPVIMVGEKWKPMRSLNRYRMRLCLVVWGQNYCEIEFDGVSEATALLSRSEAPVCASSRSALQKVRFLLHGQALVV